MGLWGHRVRGSEKRICVVDTIFLRVRCYDAGAI